MNSALFIPDTSELHAGSYKHSQMAKHFLLDSLITYNKIILYVNAGVIQW